MKQTMHFRENIRFLRNRKDRTQDDVASALEMKRSTLSGYENGVAQPNIDAIILFAKYFSISIDSLLKINLAKLSDHQMKELEHGSDVFITGTKLRVLTTSVDNNNEENIETRT